MVMVDENCYLELRCEASERAITSTQCRELSLCCSGEGKRETEISETEKQLEAIMSQRVMGQREGCGVSRGRCGTGV